jgi:hypothetical protein
MQTTIFQQSPKTQKLWEIDNPGKGDCAFYSFALGLIYLLKAELQNTVDRPLMSKIQVWLMQKDNYNVIKAGLLMNFRKPLMESM